MPEIARQLDRLETRHTEDMRNIGNRFNDYVRMEVYKENQTTMKEDIAEIKSDQRTTRNMVITAIIAIIGQIVVQLILRGSP